MRCAVLSCGTCVRGQINKPDGLMPLYVDVHSGQWTSAHVSLGAMGDSAFEYLLKVCLHNFDGFFFLCVLDFCFGLLVFLCVDFFLRCFVSLSPLFSRSGVAAAGFEERVAFRHTH